MGRRASGFLAEDVIQTVNTDPRLRRRGQFVGRGVARAPYLLFDGTYQRRVLLSGRFKGSNLLAECCRIS